MLTPKLTPFARFKKDLAGFSRAKLRQKLTLPTVPATRYANISDTISGRNHIYAALIQRRRRTAS